MPLMIQRKGGIRSNNTTISTDGHTVRVTLHSTVIATLNPDKSVMLDTGGWNTPTTLRRMNECLHAWGRDERVSKSSFAYTNIITIGTKP